MQTEISIYDRITILQDEMQEYITKKEMGYSVTLDLEKVKQWFKDVQMIENELPFEELVGEED